MASQNPSQRSSTPKPLHRPRTKPLATIGRRSGQDMSSTLSVHFGVQGRIISSTPKVAHTVTSSNARMRRSQIAKLEFTGGTGLTSAEGVFSLRVCWFSSESETGGIALGSTLTDCSEAVASGSNGWLQSHPGILRPQGFNPLGHVAIIDIAGIDLE